MNKYQNVVSFERIHVFNNNNKKVDMKNETMCAMSKILAHTRKENSSFTHESYTPG